MPNEGFTNYNTNNFDPNSLAHQTSTAILFTVVSDVSPSIYSYVDAMNTASRDVFMQELKNCHRKNDILIKNITFNDRVSHKSGFLPIVNLQDDYLEVVPSGSGTALYKAVEEALEQMISYRKDLELQGIECRSCIYIITDGEDNSSPSSSVSKINDYVKELRANEAWASSFTINMLGVGNASYFESACVTMGLDPKKCLDTIGATAAEIRKHMGVISQSVSSSTAGATVNF